MPTPSKNMSRKMGNRSTATAKTARRPAASAAKRRNGKARPAPRFSRVDRSISVTPPDDCKASVIFKQVAHDDARRFVYWLLVGRYEQDTIAVRYKFTGEKTLRCDVPDGGQLGPEALQPYLVEFLESEGNEPEGPPILDGMEK
jgi:hypothetical protein